MKLTEVYAKGFRQRSKGVWEKVGGATPAFPGPGGDVEPKKYLAARSARAWQDEGERLFRQ